MSKRGNILMTLAEEPDKTTSNHMAVKYSVDEEDCFEFAEGLKDLGYDVHFVNWNDFNGKQFSRMFNYNKSRFINPKDIDIMDLIFSYKQEDFLFPENHQRYSQMISRFERSPAIVVNNPKTIRWNMSKTYLFDLAENGIDVIPTYEVDENLIERVNQREKFVFKPKIGERGLGQRLVQCSSDLEWLKGQAPHYLAQEFCPDIRSGERSLVFIGHEFTHAVLKQPNPNDPNEYRCNESRGGTVTLYHPSIEEFNYANRLLDYVSQRFPIIFSRIDLVDVKGRPVLMEAELLNPSIYANYIGVGKEFGRKFANHLDGLIQRGKR